MKPLTLAIILDVPLQALGTVESVRLTAAAVYVYSLHDTADLAVLERSPNYLGTDLDVWCWYGARPRDLGTWPPGRWQLHEGIGHDLKRHEFRVPEMYWGLVQEFYSPAAVATFRQMKTVMKTVLRRMQPNDRP